MVGGLDPNTLKKLKGDKLGVPFSSIVLANAIGLVQQLLINNRAIYSLVFL